MTTVHNATTPTIDRAIFVNGRAQAGPAGVRIIQGAPFAGRARRAADVTQVVIHESVTRTVTSTEAVLRKRNLSVHLMVGPSGEVQQHGDLARLRLVHSGSQNGPSVAIDVVNPYYPGLRDRIGLSTWKRVLKAAWAHKGRYLVPTPAQAEATAQLIGWLTSPASTLGVPRVWPGVLNGRLRMGPLPAADPRAPGIWAHHYTAHADGAWPVLYAWLRLEARMDADVAYEQACQLAEQCTKGWITLPAQ